MVVAAGAWLDTEVEFGADVTVLLIVLLDVFMELLGADWIAMVPLVLLTVVLIPLI